MEAANDTCDKASQDNNKAHVNAVNCRFDTYEDILEKADFKDLDALEGLRNRYLAIAAMKDQHKISDEKAKTLYETATAQFNSVLQSRDAIRKRAYVGAMTAISQDFQQAPHYTPAPMPSFACTACQETN